jgi:hypothetical protein
MLFVVDLRGVERMQSTCFATVLNIREFNRYEQPVLFPHRYNSFEC